MTIEDIIEDADIAYGSGVIGGEFWDPGSSPDPLARLVVATIRASYEGLSEEVVRGAVADALRKQAEALNGIADSISGEPDEESVEGRLRLSESMNNVED